MWTPRGVMVPAIVVIALVALGPFANSSHSPTLEQRCCMSADCLAAGLAVGWALSPDARWRRASLWAASLLFMFWSAAVFSILRNNLTLVVLPSLFFPPGALAGQLLRCAIFAKK